MNVTEECEITLKELFVGITDPILNAIKRMITRERMLAATTICESCKKGAPVPFAWPTDVPRVVWSHKLSEDNPMYGPNRIDCDASKLWEVWEKESNGAKP